MSVVEIFSANSWILSLKKIIQNMGQANSFLKNRKINLKIYYRKNEVLGHVSVRNRKGNKCLN